MSSPTFRTFDLFATSKRSNTPQPRMRGWTARAAMVFSDCLPPSRHKFAVVLSRPPASCIADSMILLAVATMESQLTTGSIDFFRKAPAPTPAPARYEKSHLKENASSSPVTASSPLFYSIFGVLSSQKAVRQNSTSLSENLSQKKPKFCFTEPTPISQHQPTHSTSAGSKAAQNERNFDVVVVAELCHVSLEFMSLSLSLPPPLSQYARLSVHPSHPICRPPFSLFSRIIGVANLTLWSGAFSHFASLSPAIAKLEFESK